MALVCPAGHPPGVGTSYCRLCGRDYLEVTEVVETLVPVQEPPVEARAVVPPAPPAPPVVQAPPPPPAVPEVVPVPAPVAIQVTMPLIPVSPDKPSPTAVTPVDLGGPVIAGHDEPEPDKPGKVRRELDRAALLAGVVGGFFGGAVSGATAAFLLS